MQYRSVTVLAPAKLNLSLDVVGTLPNGYHDLDMVMQTIDLYEKITLRRSHDLTLNLPGSFVPANDKNTAVKAALAFFAYTGLLAGVDMTIYKRVPVRAGMAGGSADAAGVLVGLNELYGAKLSMSELCAIGAGIGADVPFALMGGTCRVRGVGGLMNANVTDYVTGKKMTAKGIRVEMDGEGIVVNLFILLRYGCAVSEVAQKVQSSVFAALEGMTGFQVNAVNVHVGGISFD